MQSSKYVLFALWMFVLFSCRKKTEGAFPVADPYSSTEIDSALQPLDTLVLDEDLAVSGWFDFVDTLLAHPDTSLPYTLSEHLLAQANPWLIDSLAHTDYYYRKELGDTLLDQPAYPLLDSGTILLLPSAERADSILAFLDRILIDVNIPEFRMRLWAGDSLLHIFPVRVGRYERKYLKMAGQEVDLRTATGRGAIVRINRRPTYINPCDSRIYKVTRRDDGISTKTPLIPWLEPELDGRRPGHMIHPTTNPATLGRAFSNGCVGLSEEAAWRLYYHAPLGTEVVFRYDLKIINEAGDTVRLKDIYGRGE